MAAFSIVNSSLRPGWSAWLTLARFSWNPAGVANMPATICFLTVADACGVEADPLPAAGAHAVPRRISVRLRSPRRTNPGLSIQMEEADGIAGEHCVPLVLRDA